MDLDYIHPGMNEQKAAQNDGTMVTVICVTYEHEEFISQALDSIVSQKTNFKFKVFVGEDCGPDRTADIVREYAKKYPDIVIPFIRETNLGSKQNMVDLIRHATSPYICFCDGDDYWIDPFKLQKQFDYMERYPTVRACFARARIEAPANWYLNDYFKADEHGERILPDCLPGFRIPNRLLAATDIIKYHPMHTVTVFYRWNYDVDFPDWFFYGVLGDIPMSLLQIGAGKVAFLPDLVGVYRRNNHGVHMFSNKDEHFVETRPDYINYLEGIKKDFSCRFGSTAMSEINRRLKQEWNNLLRAALRCNRLDIVANTIKEFPDSASIILNAYCTFYDDGRRMWGNYTQQGYQLVARNRYFMHSFAPFLRIFCKIHKILKTNWIKKVLKAPYSYLFDRKLSSDVLEAFNTNAELVWNDLPIKTDWFDFLEQVQNKNIIFCGFGPGVWNFLRKYPDFQNRIQCIIGFGETASAYKMIPIIEWNNFAKLDKDFYSESVFLLTDSHAMRLSAAMEYMDEIGIKNYYSYIYMEAHDPQYIKLKPLYDFKYKVKQLVQKNGLLKNIFLFETVQWLRRHRLFPGWRQFEQIKKLKDIHKEETCYIIGTAPSLTLSDIELLKDKITFSVNGIYRIFDDTEWRPTYYAICDPNACIESFKYFKERHGERKIEDIDWDSFCTESLFMPEPAKKYLINSQHTKKCYLIPYSYLNQHINPYFTMFKYQKELSYGSYNMRTVINFCINIAHYMGFKKIVLLGVDCDYTGVAQYFDGSNNIHVTNSATKALKPYNALITQKEMVKSYNYVRNLLKDDAIEIINASRGGQLEVFQRVDLENILET